MIATAFLLIVLALFVGGVWGQESLAAELIASAMLLAAMIMSIVGMTVLLWNNAS